METYCNITSSTENYLTIQTQNTEISQVNKLMRASWQVVATAFITVFLNS